MRLTDHPTTPQWLSSSPAVLDEIGQALRQAEAGGQAAELSDAYLAMGRIYRRHGAIELAVSMLEQALCCCDSVVGVDQNVDILCEQAEILAHQAEALDAQDRATLRAGRDKARDSAYEAVQLASRSTDPFWEVTVLLRMSDLLDRLGDHEDATELQVRALRHGAPAVDQVNLGTDEARAQRH